MEHDVFVIPLDGEAPPGAHPAYSEPRIIVRIDDTYWIPLAMVPYRLADANSPEKEDGVNAVISRFNEAALAQGVSIAVLDSSRGFVSSDQSTDWPSSPRT